MEDLKSRLTSRKFLLAVAAAITAIANHDMVALLAIVLGYFGVNALEKK